MAILDAVSVGDSIAFPAQDPQFEHQIRPWSLLASAAFFALLLVAFFIYGQISPGA